MMSSNTKALLDKVEECHTAIQSLSKEQDVLWENFKTESKLDENTLDWVFDYVYNDCGFEAMKKRIES